MAEQTLVVRLKAVVDDYKRAMGEAAKSSDAVVKSTSQIGSGDNLKRLGSDLTTKVTVPLVAAGVGAAKLAMDFDQSFGRMQALAGVTAEQVDGLKSSVMSLAGDTGRGPQELADALYFASSAGFDSAAAMDIVTQSAKAAAAGLGDTATVVQAVTSVMGAYGSDVISASQATDILVASAKIAKVEASELAPQLGRLLPSAKLLGVGFGDLAGALGFLTTISGDASLSATQLDGVLRKLQDPTEQGRKALAAMGTSVDELRAAIAQRGLPGALDLIKAKFGSNSQALGQLFDDSQALAGAQLILTDTTGNFAAAMSAANNATGAGAEAFKKTDGPARDMQKAMAELQVALIRIGEAIAPFAAEVAGFVGTLADLFASLPDPALAAIAAIGGFAVVLGPIISIAIHAKRAQTELMAMGAAGQLAAGGLGLLGKASVVIGVLATLDTVLQSLGRDVDKANMTDLQASLVDLASSGRIGGEGAKYFGENLHDLKNAIGEIVDTNLGDEIGHINDSILSWGGHFSARTLDDAKEKLKELDQALSDIAKRNPEAARAALDAITRGLAEQGVPAEHLLQLLPQYKTTLTELDTQQKLTGGSAGGLAASLVPPKTAAEQAKEAVDHFRTSLDELFGSMFGTEDATDALQKRLNDLPDVLKRAREDGLNLAAGLGDMSNGGIALRDHMRDMTTAAIELIDQWRQQGVSGDELNGRITNLSQSLRDQALAAGVPAPIVDNYIQLLYRIPSTVNTAIGANVDPALANLRALGQLLQKLGDGTTTIEVDIAARNVNQQRWGGIQHARSGMIATAAMGTLWNEPATGDEAYVPRLGDAQRSLGILDTAAGWYGASVVPRSYANAQSASGGGGPVVFSPTITINGTDLSDPYRTGQIVAGALMNYGRRAGFRWLESELAGYRR